MRRQNELRDELQNSVEAMQIMIESQQRIDELTRSLNELRELHRRMVEAGIGQESDSEDEDEACDEEDEKAMSCTEDEEVFELEEDCISNLNIEPKSSNNNPISSTFTSSPSSARKHGHT